MSALAGPTSVRVKRPGRAVLLAALTTSLVVSAGPAFSGAGEPRTAESEPAARSGTSAGTLVYIKDFNVWIARGDGSGARALTKDGTLPFPYGSPSQSDAGTIVASYNKTIVRMDQQGRVLNTMDPAPLHTSAGENIDGTPIDLAISPDGTKIAYTFSQVQCSTGDSCSATGYTEATRFSPVGNPTYFWDPSWVTNTRTLHTGGWNSQVQLHDLGSAPKYWFDDRLMHPFPDSTDLGDTELSPDGRHLVAIRGYGNDTAMAWYDVRGSAQQGPPPALPILFCRIYEPGIAGPTWAPDGDSLAWTEDDGIWTKSGVDDCSATQGLLIPRRIRTGLVTCRPQRGRPRSRADAHAEPDADGDADSGADSGPGDRARAQPEASGHHRVGQGRQEAGCQRRRMDAEAFGVLVPLVPQREGHQGRRGPDLQGRPGRPRQAPDGAGDCSQGGLHRHDRCELAPQGPVAPGTSVLEPEDGRRRRRVRDEIGAWRSASNDTASPATPQRGREPRGTRPRRANAGRSPTCSEQPSSSSRWSSSSSRDRVRTPSPPRRRRTWRRRVRGLRGGAGAGADDRAPTAGHGRGLLQRVRRDGQQPGRLRQRRRDASPSCSSRRPTT